MLFFKKPKVSRKFVVKQRSQDTVPFEIPTIEKKEEKKEPEFRPFVSAVHGTMVKDETFVPQNDSDITQYDAFRKDPIVKDANPYKGFNMVEEPDDNQYAHNVEETEEEDKDQDYRYEESIDEEEESTVSNDDVDKDNDEDASSPFTYRSYDDEMSYEKEQKETQVQEAQSQEEEEPEYKQVSSNTDTIDEYNENQEDDGEYINDLIPNQNPAPEPSIFKYDEEGTKDPDKSVSEEMFDTHEEKPAVKKSSLVKQVETEKVETVEESEDTKFDPDQVDEYGMTFKDRCIINSGYKPRSYKNYKKPSMDIFNTPENDGGIDEEFILQEIDAINKVLQGFRIEGKVEKYTQGPTFTRFSLSLGVGISGSKIANMQTDLQRYLQAQSLRIQNPIPGTFYIGIEVPNRKRRTVCIRELLEKKEFVESKNPLDIPIGLDVEGRTSMVNVEKFPHALVAGASGSGKSVFLNSLITTLMVKNSPDQLRFFFIDPKRVDLSKFSKVPHMIAPVVSDVKPGIAGIKWLIQEMERRLSIYHIVGCSGIKEYKRLLPNRKDLPDMPYIVAIIDECGDFLMDGGAEAQDLITKLIQKSRAAGIHLILALQKPVAKIMSTAIKSNASTRFAFRVASSTDSMLILGETGAEDLLGMGDMICLYDYPGRYQAAYIDDQEIENICNYVCTQGPQDFYFDPNDMAKKTDESNPGSIDDELFPDVARFTIDQGKWSTNQVCQHFKMAYNRANRIAQVMEYYQIIEPVQGTKPRTVLKTREELEIILGNMK